MSFGTRAPLTRRDLIAAGGGAALTATASIPLRTASPTTKPANILLLIADDMRFDAMGITGNRIVRTPSLDKLALDSAIFINNFVTTSICAVSRASIMTGQYALTHGINDFHSPLSQAQLQSSFIGKLRATHFTGFIGKWGIGEGTPLPSDHFDVWDGFERQGHYVEPGSTGKHLTERQAEAAQSFLRRAASSHKPFALTVSFKAPHAQDGEAQEFPTQADFSDYYANVTIPAPATATPEHAQRQPDFLKHTESARRWEKRFASPERFQDTVKRYYRLISGMDRAVGQMLATLQETGHYDDTLILFTSDNGFFFGEHGFSDKWWMYEESIRTPLLLRLPSSNSPKGALFYQLTLNIDIASTILAAAGLEIGHSHVSRDLAALVRDPAIDWRREFYYEHAFEHPAIPKSEGVRTERWKYIHWPGQANRTHMLFDLKNDPQEETDLAQDERFRTQLATMQDRMRAVRQEIQNDPR